MQLARFRGSIVAMVLLLVGAAWGQEGKDAAGKTPPAEGEQGRAVTPGAKVGQPAPEFTLVDCTGKKHTLSDQKDKVVVLEWVNQECPWSLKAVPVMKDLRKKYADKGVVWIGIDSTASRKPDDNIKYIKDKELDFPILMDNDGKVGRLYGAKTTPHIYVIKKGVLVYMGGLHNDQYERKPAAEFRNYLDDALTAVLAGKDVPMTETTPWGCAVKYKASDRKQDSPQKKPERNQEQPEPDRK